MDGKMMDGKMMMGGMCKCPHHKMIPLFIILFGVDFLLGTLGVLNMYTVNIIWPILIILGGLMKMTKGMCKCCAGHMGGMGGCKSC